MQFGMLERGHGSGKVTKFSATVDSFLRSVLITGSVLVAKLCPTLVTPWTVACQVPLSMGFSRREYWSGLSCPPPGNLPHPGIAPFSPVAPALQANLFTTQLPGKP